MKNSFIHVILFIALGVIGYESYLIQNLSKHSTPPSTIGAIDASSTRKEKHPDATLVDHQKTMPTKETLINLSPEYTQANQVLVEYGTHKAVPGIPDITLKLADITNDGRCPSDVNCVIAGWATAIVEAKYNELVVREEVQIQGGGQVFYRTPSEKNTPTGSNIIRIGDYVIYAAALFPYPNSMVKPSKEQYVMSFFLDTEKNITERKQLNALARIELEKHIADYKKYFILDIVDVYTLHAQQKKVTFHDPMDAHAAKYSVVFSWQQGWVATAFNAE